jgi:hypothetical protein
MLMSVCVNTLSQLLVLFSDVPIDDLVPESTRQNLRSWLIKWILRRQVAKGGFPTEAIPLTESFLMLHSHLELEYHGSLPLAQVRVEKQSMKKEVENLEVCSNPTCENKALIQCKA